LEFYKCKKYASGKLLQTNLEKINDTNNNNTFQNKLIIITIMIIIIIIINTSENSLKRGKQEHGLNFK